MKINLKITTPYGDYYQGEADYVSAVASDGQLGIQPGHTPLITPLKISKLVVTIKGEKIEFAIGGGVLVVEKDITRLILNSIEAKKDIDLQRAYDSKKRAEERLYQADTIDVKRAQASLARALNRISVKEDN